MTTQQIESVLRWFTGKAREKAVTALDLLQRSEAAGGWIPFASRAVHAGLGKSNVAVKMANANLAALSAINHYMVDGQYNQAKADLPSNQRGRYVEFALHSTLNGSAQALDFPALHAAAPAGSLVHGVLDEAERYAQDFAPFAALVKRLDATRPRPVFTSLGASPTVSATLRGLGLDARPDSVRVCEIEWETVERNGKFFSVGTLLWPAGTVHGASRYNWTKDNRQCQACGHAIKNAFNWVPLLIDNTAGVPHSLWVGRDCAKTLFGIRVDGEIELRGRV